MRLRKQLTQLASLGSAFALAHGLQRYTSQAEVTLEQAIPDAKLSVTNYEGKKISLWEGPALTLAISGAALISGAISGDSAAKKTNFVEAVGTLGVGLVGFIDDIGEQVSNGPKAKGLKGHFKALKNGNITTGQVKVGAISAIALVTAYKANADASTRYARIVQTIGGGALIAGSANLMNLLDLRPGRALKSAAIYNAAVLASSRTLPESALAMSGASLAVASQDLKQQSMLGDCGANSLGYLCGVTAQKHLGTKGQLVALGVILGLNLASEKVSFTKVIASNPVLNWLDQLGRK